MPIVRAVKLAILPNGMLSKEELGAMTDGGVLLQSFIIAYSSAANVMPLNLFCLSTDQAPGVLVTVQGLYDQYRLGLAKRPTVGTWIHSVATAFP